MQSYSAEKMTTNEAPIDDAPGAEPLELSRPPSSATPLPDRSRFRKTHARHVSYDDHAVLGASRTQETNVNAFASSLPPSTGLVKRTQSLSLAIRRQPQDTETTSVGGSHSDYSSLASSSTVTTASGDSSSLGGGAGGSPASSKRSSLDRRSADAQWSDFRIAASLSAEDEQEQENGAPKAEEGVANVINFTHRVDDGGSTSIFQRSLFSAFGSSNNKMGKFPSRSSESETPDQLTVLGGHRRQVSSVSASMSMSSLSSCSLAADEGVCCGESRSSSSLSTSSKTVTPKGEVQKVAPSTTALILENRPSNLPAKSAEEAEKHRREYERMVEAARKKEHKEAQRRQRALEAQLEHEAALVAATRAWTDAISDVATWERARGTRRVRELWWRGVPPSVRGRVWKLAIGNALGITPQLFELCVDRARERRLAAAAAAATGVEAECSHFSAEAMTPPAAVDRESTVELIHLDVARTFPSLGIFQMGGPYYELLLNVLGAYVCYRPDVGYVQGMSFLAAVLLLNMDVADAFACLANLLERPCQIAFFRMNRAKMDAYFGAYELFFGEQMARLAAHLRAIDVTPDLYLLEWLFTLYSKSLPLDVACRVWDVYLRDGEQFLFRTALGILSLYEEILVNLDFDHCVQFLTHLPETISGDELFRSIERLRPLNVAAAAAAAAAEPVPRHTDVTVPRTRRFGAALGELLASISAPQGAGLHPSASVGSFFSLAPLRSKAAVAERQAAVAPPMAHVASAPGTVAEG